MHDEASHLALLDVVKANNANIAVAVLSAAFAHFIQNFLDVGAIEHGKLPHGPIALVRVAVLVELDARDIALLNHVFNLTIDLLVR